jgi:hypothetical protein
MVITPHTSVQKGEPIKAPPKQFSMDRSRFRTSCVPTFYVLNPLSRVFLETLGVAISPSVALLVAEIALVGVAALSDAAGPVVDVAAAVAVVEPAAVAFVVPASVSEAAEPAVSVALVSVVDAA